MRTIELHVQEQWNFCLCSVLQAIFKRYGLTLSQKEIAKNLTPAEMGFIHNDSKAKRLMEKNGFSYSSFGAYETPFNEPYEVLKEMFYNEGIIGINTHVYLLKDFKEPKLILIDPKNKKEVKMFYQDLLRKMGHTGFFGLVKYMS